MKRRLFWKILIGVWAMFFAVAVAFSLWIQWQFYRDAGYRAELIGTAQEHGRRQVVMASIALRYGGTTALNELLTAWSGEDRNAFSLRRATKKGSAAAEPEEPRAAQSLTSTKPLQIEPISLTVAGADGTYRLTYNPPLSEQDYATPFQLYLYAPELVEEALAGLLFSFVLAWHLTRPLQRLRQGMDRLAGGDLTARLDLKTSGRRDEIGDVARDFDRVAARLEDLVKARERLLHEVSHECRSPLTRIRVAIDLARQDPSKAEGSFDRIDEESRRLDGMIGDLLTLARAESGVARADGFVDVRALVQAVVRDARFEAGPASVEIRIVDVPSPRVDEALPPVCGDVELLRRTLDNVLRNALSVSRRGQGIEVRVGTDAAAGVYVIEVADEGPGVSPESLAAIFEPFVRADSRASSGFGLGLAIAKRAIEALRGSIAATNRASGGLVVSIRLPFANAEGGGAGQFA